MIPLVKKKIYRTLTIRAAWNWNVTVSCLRTSDRKDLKTKKAKLEGTNGNTSLLTRFHRRRRNIYPADKCIIFYFFLVKLQRKCFTFMKWKYKNMNITSESLNRPWRKELRQQPHTDKRPRTGSKNHAFSGAWSFLFRSLDEN